MQQADVLIIGGGIIGMSVAYHLLRKMPDLRVAVLEKEEAPGLGATSKATGGIRYQFSTPTNIQLSLLSRPEWETFGEQFGVDMGYTRHGYLFVTASPETMAGLQGQATLQQGLGVPTQVLTPADIHALVPAMHTSDLCGGTICPWDGSGDPYSALTGYWHRARELGARVLTDCPVTAVTRAADRVTGVRTPRGDWAAPVVVNAAGPYAGEVGRLAGVDVPVQPYKRSVFVAAPLPELGARLPLCVDLDTGWYVHQDRQGNLLLGGTDKISYPGYDTVVNWDDLQRVLTAGVQRFPGLEQAQVGRAYAGLREITPDFHAILGPAPELFGFYLACGFSGHGFMHAPAAGRLTAEFILDGSARSLNAAPLLLERFRTGRYQDEQAAF